MSDRVPKDLPGRMPENMPEDMPDHMPEDMSDRMPNKMSEDMSEERLRSGREHWARMVVVEVRQGTLGVDGRG